MKDCKIFLLAILLPAALQAQTWIDVTDAYITNPNYDNNDVSTGWQGTGFGVANPHDNAEHYQRSFDSYQLLTGLTPGQYRLSICGFYRSGDSQSDYDHYLQGGSSYQHAELYATTSQQTYVTKLELLGSGASEAYLGGGATSVYDYSRWASLYVPNDMQSAYYWFQEGYYKNQVQGIQVGQDGQLTIGVRKSTTLGSDWVCIDTWRLEYYGQQIQATALSLPSTQTLGLGSSIQLQAQITPSNVTQARLSWTTSDNQVVSVDNTGLITALSQGTATITASTTDGSNLKARCVVTVNFDNAADSRLVINELMPANVDMFVDPSWNYGSWIELYNPTDQDMSVATFWLSDSETNLQQVRIPTAQGLIPAHGYRTLWFDHTDTAKDIAEHWVNPQLDMKLDCEGGSIFLSDPDGNIIARQTYPQAFMRCSYARTGDGNPDWAWTASPTPGSSNSTSTFASVQLADPVCNTEGQVFSGNLTVGVDIPTGAQLYYTTDGSTPTSQSKRSTNGRFTISSTTVLRLRLYQQGYLPSNVVTRSYIYADRPYYLPVVSLVTDQANLYDNTIGIYVSGTNGKTANQDGTKRNFNMEWDRPASFEYIANGNNTENADGYFDQEVDICISGGWSRKYTPRSFKVKATKVYGLKNTLDYPFFADKPYNRNKALLLRNGGNDEYNQTRLKDAALQQIARVSQFPLNLQSYQPVHVFINGDYLAMLNLREPSNKHYGYANAGIATDEIDAFEMSVDSGYVQKDGTKEAFRQWYTLSAQASDALTYQQICQLVDIDDYINYMAFKFFLNDWDWPHNNAKGFRDRNDGRFHFVIFDLDNCVDRTGNNIFQDFQNKQTYTFYSRPEYGNTSITAEVELVTIFLNMLRNADFRRQFIDTYCIVGGSVFGDEEEIQDIVYSMADRISESLSWEGHSPYGYGRSFADGIVSAVTGDYRQRMTNVLRNYQTFQLGGTAPQAVRLSTDSQGASISINGIQVPRNRFDGYLFAPVTLKAEAPLGQKFLGWRSSGTSTVRTSLFDKGSQWSYYDRGSLDGEDWTSVGYNTRQWNTSTAPFGYGNAGKPMSYATTQLNKTYAGSRIPTCYFRHEFTLQQLPADATLHLDYELDDAALIYVNGQEVDNYHLWSGASFDECCQDRGQSNWYEGDNPYTSTVDIPASLLRQGKNVIAVEVHNCNATSSDLWWDADLVMEQEMHDETAGYLSTEAEFQLPQDSQLSLEAVFGAEDDADLLLSSGTVPVKVNEVSAGNSVHVNDYYKKDDWIELYNPTDQPQDIAGMYISDKAKNPLKYQIPADLEGLQTIIPAHGHLVLWASKRDIIGQQIHTNFKLDNDADKPGTVILTAADLSWSDTLSYTQHEGNASVGRYPDGGRNVYHMTQPTIGRTNVLTTASDLLYQYVYTGVDQTEQEDAIATLQPADGYRLEQYISLDGKQLGTNRQALRPGIYLVRYRNAQGETKTIKQIIK